MKIGRKIVIYPITLKVLYKYSNSSSIIRYSECTSVQVTQYQRVCKTDRRLDLDWVGVSNVFSVILFWKKRGFWRMSILYRFLYDYEVRGNCFNIWYALCKFPLVHYRNIPIFKTIGVPQTLRSTRVDWSYPKGTKAGRAMETNVTVGIIDQII